MHMFFGFIFTAAENIEKGHDGKKQVISML
jgi:hypothetical protein